MLALTFSSLHKEYDLKVKVSVLHVSIILVHLIILSKPIGLSLRQNESSIVMR